MKKYLFYLLFFLLPILSFSQTTKGSMWAFEIRGNGLDFTNLKGKDLQATNIILSIGYNFNKYLSTRILTSQDIALFGEDEVRDYATSLTLGLCAGFNAINTAENLLEVHASAGSTLGGKYDWQYMYYDCGINWGTPIIKSCPKIRWNLGLGIRYYNAHGNIDDRMVLYAMLGIRIN
ncbi:MAG: hypothetical protein FWH39_06235 [Bacteroidales bacterium]|nr:hypothetical protein [Bacteroidales bacterium]